VTINPRSTTLSKAATNVLAPLASQRNGRKMTVTKAQGISSGDVTAGASNAEPPMLVCLSVLSNTSATPPSSPDAPKNLAVWLNTTAAATTSTASATTRTAVDFSRAPFPSPPRVPTRLATPSAPTPIAAR